MPTSLLKLPTNYWLKKESNQDQEKFNLGSFATASRRVFSSWWVYLAWTALSLWPTTFIRTSSGTPSFESQLLHVCRSEWWERVCILWLLVSVFVLSRGRRSVFLIPATFMILEKPTERPLFPDPLFLARFGFTKASGSSLASSDTKYSCSSGCIGTLTLFPKRFVFCGIIEIQFVLKSTSFHRRLAASPMRKPQ